jgi:endonuclease/exonuclease/phosphatase (EEP) superfamily protein YafD
MIKKTSLHCNTLLHFTTFHPTTLHYTYRHFTFSHLHFTTLSFDLTPLHLYRDTITRSSAVLLQLHVIVCIALSDECTKDTHTETSHSNFTCDVLNYCCVYASVRTEGISDVLKNLWRPHFEKSSKAALKEVVSFHCSL